MHVHDGLAALDGARLARSLLGRLGARTRTRLRLRRDGFGPSLLTALAETSAKSMAIAKVKRKTLSVVNFMLARRYLDGEKLAQGVKSAKARDKVKWAVGARAV